MTNSYQVDPQMVDALLSCMAIIMGLVVVLILVSFADIITTIHYRKEIKLLNSRFSKIEGFLNIKSDGGLHD